MLRNWSWNLGWCNKWIRTIWGVVCSWHQV